MVQLSGLPNNQYDFLSRNIPTGNIINVSVEEEEMELCINYEHCIQLLYIETYESYFDS